MPKTIFTGLAAVLVLSLLSGPATAQTSPVSTDPAQCDSAAGNPAAEARSMTLDVIRQAQDVQLSLGQHAQALRKGETTDTSALDAATGQALELDSQIIRLETVVGGLEIEQAALTREVLEQAKIRIEQVGDALDFQAPTGTLSSIEWCNGTINCLFLQSSCSGCFIKYDGTILPKEGGCFDPCPY